MYIKCAGGGYAEAVLSVLEAVVVEEAVLVEVLQLVMQPLCVVLMVGRADVLELL